MVPTRQFFEKIGSVAGSFMLNTSVLPHNIFLSGSKGRIRVLEVLVSEFRTTFAGIEYEVDTKTRIVNAQAFELGGSRFVRLYGGFAFHPLVSEDALAFTLLHETGHHRARGRRFAGDPRLACDCLADTWAIGPGARALRRCTGRMMNLLNALASLDATIASIDARASDCTRRSQNPQSCWAEFWPTRKSRLCIGNAQVPTGPTIGVNSAEEDEMGALIPIGGGADAEIKGRLNAAWRGAA
jgi:hypothetical protein